MRAEQIFNVHGLSAVVTGGGSGLGVAFARALADNGASVTLFDLDQEAAAATAAMLRARGGDVDFIEVSVTSLEHLRVAFGEVVARRGRLDVVFANAAITAGPGFLDCSGKRAEAGALEKLPHELWRRVQDTNLTGVFHTAQAAVPHLKKSGGGRIIVTSSTAAAKPSPTIGTAYGVTKAAVTHLVSQFAIELARHHILVNAILPGPFKTRITTPDLERVFRAASPLGRVADPEEIEGLALFLASGASSFVTGASYVIDGGLLLGRVD